MLTTYSQPLPRNSLSYSGHFSSAQGPSVSRFKLIIHFLLFSLLTKTSSLSIISVTSSATQFPCLLIPLGFRTLNNDSSTSPNSFSFSVTKFQYSKASVSKWTSSSSISCPFMHMSLLPALAPSCSQPSPLHHS